MSRFNNNLKTISPLGDITAQHIMEQKHGVESAR